MKEITLDEFARMVGKGFKETNSLIREVKTDLAEFKNETRVNFKRVYEQIDALTEDVHKIDLRLETVEKDHGRRISRVEHKLQIA